MGLGLLYHISVQELEEPKMSQTSVDVVFTQDRSRLVVVDCGCRCSFLNNFLHLRLWLLKLVKGNRTAHRRFCRNLLENCIFFLEIVLIRKLYFLKIALVRKLYPERGVVAQRLARGFGAHLKATSQKQAP